MDHESLRTASTYLNNLLLARGLLRNGQPVDFVKPSKESRAQIINLVHDLVLREDREREQREHVAITLRTMRADESRRNLEIEKLKEKKEESARAAVQARAAERAAQAEVKRVEKGTKSLQAQIAKFKTSLAQVKSQCANDVRKRDLELARLKTHLQGQQRGNKVGMTAPSITISNGARPRAAFDASVHDLRDPEYSLKQETTEFLTQLSQSLSDENDSLISLIRNALSTMRGLLGPSAGAKHPDSAVGSTGSNDSGGQNDEMLHALPTSYKTLTADMELCLADLKSILSNPNFVAVEEVEIRDEEIVRLREGWERMEERWKDVLLMMEGWRRKMVTGDTINIDDLRRGMGLVSPERRQNGRLSAEPEQSFINSDISDIRLPEIPEDSSIVFLPPMPCSPAKSSPKRKRDALEPPEFFDLRPAVHKAAPTSPHPVLSQQVHGENDEHEEESEGGHRMTVGEKLSAAQAEAEEAAAARAHEAPEMHTSNAETGARVSFGPLDGTADEQEDTLGKMPSPVKRTKIRGRPKKRKSTLSPDELEELMMSAVE